MYVTADTAWNSSTVDTIQNLITCGFQKVSWNYLISHQLQKVLSYSRRKTQQSQKTCVQSQCDSVTLCDVTKSFHIPDSNTVPIYRPYSIPGGMEDVSEEGGTLPLKACHLVDDTKSICLWPSESCKIGQKSSVKLCCADICRLPDPNRKVKTGPEQQVRSLRKGWAWFGSRKMGQTFHGKE